MALVSGLPVQRRLEQHPQPPTDAPCERVLQRPEHSPLAPWVGLPAVRGVRAGVIHGIAPRVVCFRVAVALVAPWVCCGNSSHSGMRRRTQDSQRAADEGVPGALDRAEQQGARLQPAQEVPVALLARRRPRTGRGGRSATSHRTCGPSRRARLRSPRSHRLAEAAEWPRSPDRPVAGVGAAARMGRMRDVTSVLLDKWAYGPRAARRCSCRPRSTTKPRSSTTISSLSRTVLSRCAITTRAQPRRRRLSMMSARSRRPARWSPRRAPGCWAPYQRPGDLQPLPLPAGEVAAVLLDAAVDAAGAPPTSSTAPRRAAPPPPPRRGWTGPTAPRCRARFPRRGRRPGRRRRPRRPAAPRGDVLPALPVDADLALPGAVQTRDEPGDRRLAAAGAADERDLPPGPTASEKPGQRRLVQRAVAEGDVLQRHMADQPAGARVGSGRNRAHRRGSSPVLEPGDVRGEVLDAARRPS